ncbi:MAG: class I SAM-dependent methyltransferase [Rhodobacteraceae bacterium]|nr:class I SAM-dependent methyltransferase [Paracoccaceae bacterium]
MFWRIAEGRWGRKLRRGFGRIVSWDPFFGDMKHHDFAQGRMRASRIAIVNHMIRVNGYRSYLEIGVRRRSSMFEEIHCDTRISVDPDPAAEADYPVPSDDYFARHDHRFDIVFIDGNHTGDQVERDLEHALSRLNPGGAILLHDMNPPTRFHAREVYEVDGAYPSWNGTSWKGYAALRKKRADLTMRVVDTDWGVGIVHPGSQDIYQGPGKSFDDLARDRKRLLNLISVHEFLRLYRTPLNREL